MSLRLKVEVFLIATIVLVVGLSYTVQLSLLTNRLRAAEDELAVKDLTRCIGAIDRHVSGLNAIAADWVDRPEMLTEIGQKVERGAGDGIIGSLPGNGALDAALLIGVDGSPSWSIVPNGDDESLASDIAGSLAIHGVVTEGSGVLLAPGGPVFVAIQPVADPSASGRFLVLGQRLGRELAMTLSRQTGLAFQVWSAADPEIPEGGRGLLDRYSPQASRVQVNPLGDGLIRAYAVYPDLFGNAGLLLHADLDRGFFTQTREIMGTGLIVQAVVAALALVVLVIFFRREITNPLFRMTQHTTAIAASNDLSGRLRFTRGDEIGLLAGAFDRMVEQLETDRDLQRQAKEALRKSEERFAAAVDGANDGLWDWDLQNNSVYFSPRWRAMLGYDETTVGTDPEDWFKLIHAEDRSYVEAMLDAHLKGESEHVESEYRIQHADGTYLWVLCRGLAVRDASGKLTRMAGSQSDITPRKRVEEQLAHQAFHDALTGLPNRALFLDRLGQAMRHARRAREYMFAVLFLDLDRFKVVNDGLGHVVGDKLLKSFAEALSASFRMNDTVARYESTLARFGGDEFVVLLDGIGDVADASRVSERILDLLKKPFQIEEHEVFTSVSIGIALSGADYETPEEFLRNADTAMYRAKGRGKACYEIFDLDMHSIAIERLELENDLRRAIDREEFVVFYQPIISMHTGRIDAFEALVRWNHPTRGMVSPIKFIPIAEETGMIVGIGEYVFRSACAQARAWQREFPHAAELNISINLSVKEFSRPDLLESIDRTLKETGLDPHHLKLEITESAIMENVEEVSATLMKLRAQHVQLSIDDFGTGYSSLSYLHRLPFNNLKIDQVFVKEMHKSAEDQLIVKTILMLAKNLRMNVIAEGIELQDHLATLCENGCDYGQGYFFARPLSVEDAAALLAQQKVWSGVLTRERV